MKKIFITQNLAALQLIEQSGEIPSSSDIIFYNGAWPKLSEYILTQYKSCHLISIPTIRALCLRCDGKKVRSETFFSRVKICAEIKRGYVGIDIACSLEGWLLEKLPNDRETNFEIVCYNRHCLLPFLLLQDELKNHLNITRVKEIEINNLTKGGYQLTVFDAKDLESKALTLNNFYGKRSLNHFNDIAIMIKNQFLNNRTPLCPNFSYVLDRVLGFIFANCVRKLGQSFPFFVSPLTESNVFVCQIADDTSLKMTVEEYFHTVSYLCAEKNLKNEKIVLSIHPKERSLKSILRYFKIASNSPTRVSFQTIDEIFKRRNTNSVPELNFYYVSSTAFEKYGTEQGCSWRKLDVGR